MLPATLPYSKGDLVDLALQYPDVNISVSDVLRQCATGALHGDQARLDGNINAIGNVELFGLENVTHLHG